jgi:SIR2-like protein
MLEMTELCRDLQPARTVLFLGAGSSIPSGAPSGAALARMLEEKLAGGRSVSNNLAELCSILESKVGRGSLVSAVKERLADLAPTGGLLVLPEYAWPTLYTTNFDTLLEKAYARCGKPYVPIRSNYEIGKAEAVEGAPIIKLHGCITADDSSGFKARLVLTDNDYDEYAQFRETMFGKLAFDLASKDALFIGHSLRDPDVKAQIREAVLLHRRAGAPGRLYALIYEKDPDRALLLESQGVRVAFGGIDEFTDALAAASQAPAPQPSAAAADATRHTLPVELRASTLDIAAARTLTPNVARLFNGSAATYADIEHGFTFARYDETSVKTWIREGVLAVSLVGVAGVGKTTLARRVTEALSRDGYAAWEHNSAFPLRAANWLRLEAACREAKTKALLLIDDSPTFQGQVNTLVESLAGIQGCALQIIMTGERSQWEPRKKVAAIFTKGKVHDLSALGDYDIAQMLNLLADKQDIKRLVDPTFARLPRFRQEREIKKRCSADMYVALKNIFGTESLDGILLREYAHLPNEMQEVYRSVAALEAAGARVHRQLVIRLLGVGADTLTGLLTALEGLVDEYDINAEDGLYGWRTRHEVVARTIARYKYANQEELVSLLEQVIDACNPAIYLERRTITDLCLSDYGIPRVSSEDKRIELYERIIEKAPGERVPRHRLVSLLMRRDAFDQAEYALREAVEAVNIDSPLHRYKVLLLAARAQRAEGLLVEDRRALLLEARSLAYEGIRKFSDDKHSYLVFARLASTYLAVTKSDSFTEEAVRVLREGFERLSDPQLARELRRVEQNLDVEPEIE